MTVWGKFEDMALCYLKELAKKSDESHMMFCRTLEPVYGVCTYKEFADMVALSGQGMYRPVITMDRDEFVCMLTIRYADLFMEEKDDVKKENIQTGEQPGDKHPVVDAGSDRVEKGGPSCDGGKG